MQCRKLLIGLFLLVAGGVSAQAQGRQPAARSTVDSIVIKGEKKIEEDAIRNKLVTKVGDLYSLDKVREDVQNLFDTGYFYNVVVDKSIRNGKLVLTYSLTEKPSVAEVVFKGNDELTDKELREAIGLKTYEIMDMAQVNEATDKIQKLYEDKGYFLAQVNPKIEDIKKNQTVRVKFQIQENDMVKVKKITFIGNEDLTSSKLKSVMQTKEGGFFSFLGGSGAYKEDIFEQDTQMLNFLYFNEGYVQVKIDRPEVYVSPDKKSIYITIRIQEGEQFNIGSVDFAGDIIFSQEELFDSISIQESDLFSYQALQKDLRSLQAKYGDLGYAYANVIPRTRIREQDQLVDVTFEIDKGSKVYIGEINVKGNKKTRDKVVRRELEIKEGELYNETRKRQSMNNVKRLGYFENVNFNTSTPQGREDLINIDIVVKERNTGTIQVGAGYSSYGGFLFNGQINQINLLGRGQRLGASLNISEKQSLFNINFTEPYFMDTEWEVGFDLYQTKRQLPEYAEEKRGGAIRLGHPLAPYLRGIVRYKMDDTTLDLGSDGDGDLYPVETANGITSSVTSSLIYDKRDDRYAPTQGQYSSLSLEYAGLGGDLEYTKGLANYRFYKTIFWDVVWRNNINYGFVTSNTSGEPPFNELFLLGGANTLRGYEWFSVGRRKRSEVAFDEAKNAGHTDAEAEEFAMRPFGGKQQFYYQMEFQFPLIKEAGIQGVVFYDIGYADNSIVLKDLMSDAGFGFRWFSPIGPLRFEWGFPFERREIFGDRAVNFNFSIGTPF